MPKHETFFVAQSAPDPGGIVLITIDHELPPGAKQLGAFDDPVAAIDFAQQELARLRSEGIDVQYVDPPDDLVGAG